MIPFYPLQFRKLNSNQLDQRMQEEYTTHKFDVFGVNSVFFHAFH